MEIISYVTLSALSTKHHISRSLIFMKCAGNRKENHFGLEVKRSLQYRESWWTLSVTWWLIEAQDLSHNSNISITDYLGQTMFSFLISLYGYAWHWGTSVFGTESCNSGILTEVSTTIVCHCKANRHSFWIMLIDQSFCHLAKINRSNLCPNRLDCYLHQNL